MVFGEEGMKRMNEVDWKASLDRADVDVSRIDLETRVASMHHELDHS